jgi:TatD DNase family protein
MAMSAQVSNVSHVACALHGNCYINVTNRCTLDCAFCPKPAGNWTVEGYDMRLDHEPNIKEMLVAAGNPRFYREIVFCGLGEPTLRLYTVLEAAHLLRRKGARIRINTDGLANLVYGRDVTPDMEGNVDALSISLNAQNEDVYNRLCRPPSPGAYQSLLDFTRRAGDFVPDITLTAPDGVADVDLAACEHIARGLNVKFRRRACNRID